MEDLDPFDVAILRCLQENSRQTTEAIGEAVGLSPTACQRRIKRLRAAKVIESEIAVLDPQRAGGFMTVIAQVLLDRGRVDIVDAFKRQATEVPEVQQCYYVTGEYDFVLVIVCRDMADYERLTRQVFFANSNIRRFHTSMVMDGVKRGLQIPL